jgi:hypothetical protein
MLLFTHTHIYVVHVLLEFCINQQKGFFIDSIVSSVFLEAPFCNPISSGTTAKASALYQ